MEAKSLINDCHNHLTAAELYLEAGNHEGYANNMSAILDLLRKELIGEAPDESQAAEPEQPAAEPEQPAAEPEQPVSEQEQQSSDKFCEECEVKEECPAMQAEKAKTDAAARRKAGNSPW